MLRLIILAMTLCLASAAWAQEGRDCATGETCAANLSAAQVFSLADQYIGAGQPDQAETLYRGLARDPDGDVRAEARFRLATLRESRGDLQGAIDCYRAILDEKPGAQRVRLELARVLALQGDESGARRELRRAGAAGLPEDVARAVDQFALALRSSRPLGASIEIALAPDSNINRATDRDTVDTVIAPLQLDDDARARSGLGVTLSGQAFWRADLSRDAALLSRVSARADLYGAGQFNDVVLSLASGPEFRAAGARWRPAGVYTRRWFGGDHYSDSYGGSINVLKPLNRVSQIEMEATVLANRYTLNRQQNGTLIDVNAAYDRAFSTRFSTRIGARVTRQAAAEPSLATTGFSLEAVASRQIGKQLVFIQASAGRLKSDARIPLFTEVRKDRRYDVTAGLLLRQWSFKGLSPLIRVSRSVNQSTVGLFDFKRTRVEFALSREF
ncbi:MAG: hypothetical protein ABS87_04645 [Sphingomonas sp. SCN 67-18]|uniref:surface lipoprotein assembly modifier n=1 Tax=uncultured Sphingomonas sp. TaxID=158754 RepID=UPI00086866C9|nr:surface lipoprotein assembly modifier [Sphingomonas sp. SCN 67-18]ODU21995.1 MAG: hypothetical protein ABS87_04645 [Sphingomonas sp. SCN 67-18]